MESDFVLLCVSQLYFRQRFWFFPWKASSTVAYFSSISLSVSLWLSVWQIRGDLEKRDLGRWETEICFSYLDVQSFVCLTRDVWFWLLNLYPVIKWKWGIKVLVFLCTSKWMLKHEMHRKLERLRLVHAGHPSSSTIGLLAHRRETEKLVVISCCGCMSPISRGPSKATEGNVWARVNPFRFVNRELRL